MRWDGSFAEYIARLDPLYHFARHMRMLIRALERVEAGELTRLMIFMPPRHGKTRTASELFPAYYLGRHPNHRIIAGSYSDDYANYTGSKVRPQLDDPRWPFPNVRPMQGSKALASWGIDGYAGWYHSAGTSGGMTGRGANLFLIDDPIKDRAEADSPVYRQKVHDWYNDVARSRLENDFTDPSGRQRKAAILLIQTRWHDDDLAGRLLREQDENPQADRWTVLRLPALAEADDPLGRQEGESLWEEKKSRRELEALRDTLPSRTWAAVWQQRPQKAGGTTFRLDWFAQRYDLRILPPYLRLIQVCDAAWKKGVENSYSVIHTWGRTATTYDLLDAWRQRVGYPALIDALRDNYWKWAPLGLDGLYIEDAASGISALQTLTETEDAHGIVNAIPFAVAGVGQYSFVESATPFFAAGRIRYPQSAPWLADYIAEMVGYPTVAHDDHPVATAMALRILYAGSATRKQSFAGFGQPKAPAPEAETDGHDAFASFGRYR